MNTFYPSQFMAADALGQTRTGSLAEGISTFWFGSSQEAPLYAEIYRATLLNELYLNERRTQRRGSGTPSRSLTQILGAEARKFWSHVFERRNN